MARYLNPSKIGLVALIELYRAQEAPTSASITLLSFLSSHLLSRSQHDSTLPAASIAAPTPLSLSSFESLLSPIQSQHPGRSLYDVFLSSLWSLQSFEQLGEFLERSAGHDPEDTTARMPISPFSPIGQYLRRCNLEFIRLQFDSAVALWEDLLIFREPSRATWAARNPGVAESLPAFGSDPTPISLGVENGPSPVLLDRAYKRAVHFSGGPLSQDDLERVVHFQLERLQTFGTRVSREMSDQLVNMIKQANSTLPEIHFIRFFDAWRSGAYTEAIDHLHRYFDYAMEGYDSHQSVKTYHQYALLHLAVLHADFGCFDEAIAAMNECIATAREHQDARCLNFGISWLVHLRKAHPEYAQQEARDQANYFSSSETDMLSFLQQKAVESRDWVQLSSALLCQAGSELQNGGSVFKAVELSYQSSHLNGKYALQGLQPSQTRLHASVFGRIAQASAAEQLSDIYLEVHAERASRPDLLGVVCLNAYQQARYGRYDRAFGMLKQQSSMPNKTLKMDNMILGFATMCRFREAMHQNEHFAAQRLLQQLRPFRDIAEPDVVFEIHSMEIDCMLRDGLCASASEKIEALLKATKDSSTTDIAHRIRLLILKANMWARAGKPAKGFSVALRAASSAHQALLLPELFAAINALATIFVDLREFEGARALVDSIMPQALEGGDVYLIASLYSTLTDAFVGMAGHSCAAGSREREQNLNHGLVYIERAKDAFDRLKDVDGTLACLEKKALLFRFRKEERLAEEMDRMYDFTVEQALARDNEGRGIDR